MRVLVTGGAGYIGSHTMIEVLAADHDVMVVDNFANSAPEALTRVARLSNRSFGTAEANIGDAARMTEICRDFRPEAVLHFAGLKAVGESIDIPLTYYRENVVATINLLQVLDAVDCRHIVFSSSATVYGMPQYLPCDENHPLDAINPYGRKSRNLFVLLAVWCRKKACLKPPAQQQRSCRSIRSGRSFSSAPAAMATPRHLLTKTRCCPPFQLWGHKPK